MFHKKRTKLLLAAAVAAAALLMAAAYYLLSPAGTEGEKSVTFVALDTTGATLWEGEVFTRAAYVGDALSQEGLIDGERSTLGLFVTTVAGVKAEEDRQQWWCLYLNGEMAVTAVDATPLQQGDQVLFVLMEGY